MRLDRLNRARSRFQRCLGAWLVANAGQWAVPVNILSRTGRAVQLGFDGIAPCLRVHLDPVTVRVEVLTHGQPFTWLHETEVFPVRLGQDHACAACRDDGHGFDFPSREALWIAHQFEPLRAWVAESLANAEWLRWISDTVAGHSGVELLDGRGPGARVLARGAVRIEIGPCRTVAANMPAGEWVELRAEA